MDPSALKRAHLAWTVCRAFSDRSWEHNNPNAANSSFPCLSQAGTARMGPERPSLEIEQTRKLNSFQLRSDESEREDLAMFRKESQSRQANTQARWHAPPGRSACWSVSSEGFLTLLIS